MALSDQALEMLNFAQAEAQQAEAVARWERIVRAEEYYEGRTEAETTGYFDPEMLTKISYANNNITQRIIKRISQVHKVPPITIFPEGTNEELIKSYENATKMDGVKLARGERQLNLLKMIFLKSTFRNDQLEIDVIKDFVPLMSPTDPMQPIGVAYPIHTDPNGSGAEMWAIWTATEQFKYVKGGEVILDELEGVNPYGIMPGVFCFAEGAPPETEFTDVEPAMDIIETNLGINLALTEMNANLRFQNFDYLFLSGVKNTGEITINQDSFTELPLGVEMGSIGFASHVPDTITGVKFSYQSIAMNYGLDANFIEGTQEASGKALIVRQQELMDNRSGDLENWRMIYASLYKIRKAQFAYHFNKKLPDSVQYDFRESMKIQTEEEKREDSDWLVQTGQKTYAQIMVEQNPDGFPGDDTTTPVEEAEQVIAKNIAKNKELEGSGTPPSALDIALGSKPVGEPE